MNVKWIFTQELWRLFYKKLATQHNYSSVLPCPHGGEVMQLHFGDSPMEILELACLQIWQQPISCKRTRTTELQFPIEDVM